MNDPKLQPNSTEEKALRNEPIIFMYELTELLMVLYLEILTGTNKRDYNQASVEAFPGIRITTKHVTVIAIYPQREFRKKTSN